MVVIFEVFFFKFFQDLHLFVHVLHTDVLPVLNVDCAEQEKHCVHHVLMPSLVFFSINTQVRLVELEQPNKLVDG